VHRDAAASAPPRKGDAQGLVRKMVRPLRASTGYPSWQSTIGGIITLDPTIRVGWRPFLHESDDFHMLDRGEGDTITSPTVS